MTTSNVPRTSPRPMDGRVNIQVWFRSHVDTDTGLPCSPAKRQPAIFIDDIEMSEDLAERVFVWLNHEGSSPHFTGAVRFFDLDRSMSVGDYIQIETPQGNLMFAQCAPQGWEWTTSAPECCCLSCRIF